MFIKDLWIVLADDQEVVIIDSGRNLFKYHIGPVKTISVNLFDYLVRRIIVKDDKSLVIMV